MESVRDLFVELFGECVNIMLRRWQEAISFQESRFYIKNFQDMMQVELYIILQKMMTNIVKLLVALISF